MLLTKMAWDKGQSLRSDDLIEYLEQEPNRYRLFDQFLLRLHGRPFSIVTWLSMAWGGSIGLTYVLLRPEGTDLLFFLIAVAGCSIMFFIRQAILFPLLALFALTYSPLLLIPIALTKEHGLWMVAGYMFLTGADILLYWYVLIAGLFYILVRMAVRIERGNAPRSEKTAPLFTPHYVLKVLRGETDASRVQVAINLFSTATIIVFLVLAGPLGVGMMIWTAVLVVPLALWWEPQLWLPALVLVLGG